MCFKPEDDYLNYAKFYRDKIKNEGHSGINYEAVSYSIIEYFNSVVYVPMLEFWNGYKERWVERKEVPSGDEFVEPDQDFETMNPSGEFEGRRKVFTFWCKGAGFNAEALKVARKKGLACNSTFIPYYIEQKGTGKILSCDTYFRREVALDNLLIKMMSYFYSSLFSELVYHEEEEFFSEIKKIDKVVLKKVDKDKIEKWVLKEEDGVEPEIVELKEEDNIEPEIVELKEEDNEEMDEMEMPVRRKGFIEEETVVINKKYKKKN